MAALSGLLDLSKKKMNKEKKSELVIPINKKGPEDTIPFDDPYY